MLSTENLEEYARMRLQESPLKFSYATSDTNSLRAANNTDEESVRSERDKTSETSES